MKAIAWIAARFLRPEWVEESFYISGQMGCTLHEIITC